MGNKSESVLTKKHTLPISWQGVLLVVIGAIMAVIFTFRALRPADELSASYKQMSNAAASMSGIASRAGTSIDEAYYQDHGKYLDGEVKALEAIEHSTRSTSVALDLIGLMISAAVFVAGTRMEKR